MMKISVNVWKQASFTALILFAGTSTMATAATKGGGALNGNIASTSTYVWRGLAKTGDAAIQGSLNYASTDGIHAGLWTSNVSSGGTAGSELDVTVGYAGKAKGFEYDVGLIAYTFPQYEEAAGGGDYNFNEFYASVSKDMLNARFSTSSEAGSYIEVNANFEKLISNLDLGLHFGSYSVDEDFDGLPGEDYNDYNVSLAATVDGFNFRFTLSDTNLDNDAYRTIITISKNFDF